MSGFNFERRIREFNWLTFFALLCVVVTSAFIIIMTLKLTDTLASPDWCARAIKAEQLSGVRPTSSCIDLLTIQLKSLALDNHIYAITLAVCLGVLVVVVLAKARLDLEASKDSFKASVAEAAATGAATGAAVGAAVQTGGEDVAGS